MLRIQDTGTRSVAAWSHWFARFFSHSFRSVPNRLLNEFCRKPEAASAQRESGGKSSNTKDQARYAVAVAVADCFKLAWAEERGFFFAPTGRLLTLLKVLIVGFGAMTSPFNLI
jgi:hypothetical protein